MHRPRSTAWLVPAVALLTAGTAYGKPARKDAHETRAKHGTKGEGAPAKNGNKAKPTAPAAEKADNALALLLGDPAVVEELKR